MDPHICHMHEQDPHDWLFTALSTHRHNLLFAVLSARQADASRIVVAVTGTDMPEEVGPREKSDQHQPDKQDDTSGERRPVQTPLASPTTSLQVPGHCADHKQTEKECLKCFQLTPPPFRLFCGLPTSEARGQARGCSVLIWRASAL